LTDEPNPNPCSDLGGIREVEEGEPVLNKEVEAELEREKIGEPRTDCEEMWNPMFIMIPSRLGIEKVNRVYIPHIKYILKSKFSVGIIGGKPRASLYFIGVQDDYIIYLDPHIVQPSIRLDHYVLHDLETYHCRVPLKMPIVNIDPSIAIGFFIKTKHDLDDFIKWHKKFEDEGNATIFSIACITPNYVNNKYQPQQTQDTKSIVCI